jgi:hypothetical protein
MLMSAANLPDDSTPTPFAAAAAFAMPFRRHMPPPLRHDAAATLTRRFS